MGKKFTTFANILCFLLLTIVSTGTIYSGEARKDLRELNNHGQPLLLAGRATTAQTQAFSIGRGEQHLSPRSISGHASAVEKLQNRGMNPSHALSPLAKVTVVDTATVITLYDTTLHIYTYNSLGRILTESVKKLTNGQWVDSSRVTYTYNASGQLLTELDEVSTNGQWVGTYRYTYTYDAKGNFLTELDEQFTNGAWVNTYLYTDTYNANGQFEYEVYQQWTNGAWLNQYRYTDTYDTKGNFQSELVEQWVNNAWVSTSQYTYTYDANGRFLSYTRQIYTNGQWVNSGRYTNTYNANGQNVAGVYQEWVDSLNAWVNSDSSAYTYDASGRVLTEVYAYWSGTQWVNDARYTYTYDANGNTLTELDEYWSGSQWVSSSRYTYTYGTNGLFATGKYEEWLVSLWVPANGYYYLSDGAGNSFDYSGASVSIVYELITTGVNSTIVNIPSQYSLSQNYPNPFNPSTMISFSIPSRSVVSLKIFDLLGKEVATIVAGELAPGNYSRQWNASSVTSGVYFYRLQAGSFSETKKLMLLK